MEIRFVLQTLFEVLVAAFIIYGLIFEERFAETEKKVNIPIDKTKTTDNILLIYFFILTPTQLFLFYLSLR